MFDAICPDHALIKIPHGAICDDPALMKAASSGPPAAAAAGWTSSNPSQTVPVALFTLDNDILSPHVARATTETRIDMGNLMTANLATFFAGEPSPTPVV